MISLRPNTTPQDANGAFAVMALIADAEACATRAGELRDLLVAVNERLAAVDAAEKTVIAAQAAAIERNSQLFADKTQFEDERVAWAALVDERDAQAKILADKLSGKESDLVAREQKMSTDVELLAKREHDVAIREAAAQGAAEDAAALKADYEKRLADLRALAG